MKSKVQTNKKMKQPAQKPLSTRITSKDVARYFLYRASEHGELISNLKMQKLIYYAYVWTLVKNKKRLFDERIQAWPIGPVVPSLYGELKKYGSAPIGSDFLGVETEDEFTKFVHNKFPNDVLSTLDEVYEKYITKTPFELVLLTHAEKPWSEAREGLSPHEPSNREISDEHILNAYKLEARKTS